MNSQLAFLLVNLVLLAGVKSEKPYKICSLQKDISDCDQLKRSDGVNCETNYHGVDCLLNIEQEKTDFGRVTSEEALVAANFVKDVVVLGEFRSDIAQDDDSLYATVVLVKADYEGGLKGLQGKKYCHPGFKFDEAITELVLKEFETAVLKENDAEGCSNKVESGTVFEKELKALSDFFGPSCRPGPWIDLEDRNNKLYQQYSKLCQLCKNQCNVESGTSPFMESLECLVNRGGDVALTTVNTVYEFFNKSVNAHKRSNYKYLCRNGTVSSLENACTWSKQPWDLIIANKYQAELIQSDLKSWLSKYVVLSEPILAQNSDSFEKSLKGVLFPSETKYDRIYFQSQPTPLKDYISVYRAIPNTYNSEKCNQNLRWCTVSEAEQQKCIWLAQASLNRAIQPVINCVQTPSKLDCLDDIEKDKADVVTSDAHYGYIARKKGLAALAYPDTDPGNLIRTIVVIKDSNELGIQRFGNLKNKKACMPEYGGTEWLSFINTAREHGVLSKKTCDYGELLSEFVGDSCVPGARDSEHAKSSKTNDDKLCSLCVPHPYYVKTAKNCNSDESNKYYGNVGALNCLKEVGDFAVISKGDYSANITESEFRVLCKNGSLASYSGFKVDKACEISTIVDSEVVSKKNSPKNGDIAIALANFEIRFGRDRVKAFEVFNIFNNTKSLLFQDTTLGLDSVNSDKEHIRSYINLFAHADKCFENNKPGSATGLQATVLPLLLSFFFVFAVLF